MDKPIRVLMVNYKMQCAGIEAFIMNIYRNIDRSKVQFDFLVHYKEPQFYDEEIEQLGGRIYRLSVREDNNYIKYFKDLRNFFKEHREYSIVHGHMESFGVFYLRAAQKAGIPVRIAHCHIAQRNKGFKGTLKSILNRFYSLYATDLFACSDAAGKFLYGQNRNYSLYNNAIEVNKFVFKPDLRSEIRAELGIADDQFVIGHTGRFNRQKNHSFLIDIFLHIYKKNQSVMLLLLGEGDLMPKIKDKVEKSGIGNHVIFLGVRKDPNRIYQAMDVYVMPSLFEGLPVSGIEAQAAGLKCFFSDCVTTQTAITHNTEFISLDLSPAEWAETILKWNNNYKRCDMSKEIVKAGYDIKEQTKQLMDFYIKAKNRKFIK